MTTRKQELTADLRAVYDEWERLLSTASAQQLVGRRVNSKWVFKDVVAHLMAWQQLSIARLEAGMAGGDPKLPVWIGEADPHSEEHLHEFNTTIHRIHQEEPWPEVHRAWREGFTHLIELAETIPEETLLDTQRYAWMRGHALSDVLEGTCEHHRDHLATARRALGK